MDSSIIAEMVKDEHLSVEILEFRQESVRVGQTNLIITTTKIKTTVSINQVYNNNDFFLILEIQAEIEKKKKKKDF